MADTTFVTKSTKFLLAWAQAVNDWLYKGRNPNYATTTGSANAQILTLATGSLYTTESDGDGFWFKAGFTNTAAMTLQVIPPSGTNTARSVQLNLGALTGGEVVVGQIYKIVRLGTTWQLLSIPQLTDALPLVVNSTDITKKLRFALSGITTATTRVITWADQNLTFAALTVKGDSWWASAAGVITKLAAGADGLPLVTDSSQTTGTKWGFSNQSANTFYAGPTSGAAAAPSFRAPVGADGASSVLLGSQTAAVSATLNFASLLSSTYDEYIFTFVNLVPATDAQNFLMRLSIDNGSNYKAGAADYQYYGVGIGQDATAHSPVSGGATAFLMASLVSNVANDGGINGEVRLFGVNSTTAKKLITFHLTNYTTATGGQYIAGGGITVQATLAGSAVNAAQFLMGAGNLTSGTIYLYGVRKA